MHPCKPNVPAERPSAVKRRHDDVTELIADIRKLIAALTGEAPRDDEASAEITELLRSSETALHAKRSRGAMPVDEIDTVSAERHRRMEIYEQYRNCQHLLTAS